MQEMSCRCVHWCWAPQDLLISTIVSSCSCLWSSPFAATRGVFDEGWSLDLPVGRKVTFDCSEELAGLAKWR